MWNWPRPVSYTHLAKCLPLVRQLLKDYAMDKDQTVLVGGGGGAAAVVPHLAKTLGMKHRIAKNAQVISPIGVALSLVRDTVERTIPNPSQEDILRIREEAERQVIKAGAKPDTVEVHVEIDAPVSYTHLFTLLAPLALYRGPLNLFGLGSGVAGLMIGLGLLPATAVMSALLAVERMQAIADPTNTHNVWLAGYADVDVNQITAKLLPYVWLLVAAGVLVATIMFV